MIGIHEPHAQHINKMLFGDVILLVDVPLERSKDVTLMKKMVSALSLQLEERLIRDPVSVGSGLSIFRGYGEILQLLTEDDNRLLR